MQIAQIEWRAMPLYTALYPARTGQNRPKPATIAEHASGPHAIRTTHYCP
jgi:hypothetical protein